MRNGRSPRRSVLVCFSAFSAAFAALGCQRPLAPQVEPLALTSRSWTERAQAVEVPTIAPVGQFIPEGAYESAVPPARAALAAGPATPPEPTPLLDAIAAKAKEKKHEADGPLEVIEAAPGTVATSNPRGPETTAPGNVAVNPPGPETAAADNPAPAASRESEPAVVRVSSAEAPPVAGPETQIVIEPTPRPDRASEIDPPSPAERWRSGVKDLLLVARDEAGKNDDAADEWTLRYALLEWMNEDGDRPAGPDWRSVLAPLAHAANGSLGDTAALARELHQAVESLENLAPLEVTSVELCRKVNGFGCYEPVAASACKPGRAVIVYCEMTGVRYEQDGEHFRSRVSSQVELRRKDGGDVAWSHELGVAEDSCRRRRRDYYVNYRLDLPGDLSPGAYELLLTQTDLSTHQTASRSTSITVVP